MAPPLLIRALELELERAQAIETFRRAGLESSDYCASSCVLFEVSSREHLVGYYALEVSGPEGELEGFVVAAATARGAPHGLTEAVLPLIVKQFKIGLKRVRLYTRREGLVVRLVRMGWAAFATREAGRYELSLELPC